MKNGWVILIYNETGNKTQCEYVFKLEDLICWTCKLNLQNKKWNLYEVGSFVTSNLDIVK